MQTFLFISIGAILGANLRYWLGNWAAQRWGTQLPYGTLLINLSGSLVLGFFLTLATQRFLIDPNWRIFFATGFLGAYTTFSTYTYESIALINGGNWLLGGVNLVGSAILGGLAAILGIYLARLI
ncbi:MAG: fluoride efflux transporter CrcB [Anaerolineaceae bacterium]|nr:fluoride efflux transporter CrcB [Anaerolineaceae bacterium]